MARLSSHRLSFARIEAAARSIDPIFLDTPQFVSEPLSELLGVRLVLKVETLNPIRSFKGRGASWLLASTDSDSPLVCASAGNFGQAMAYACRERGVPLTVFAAVGANPLKVERMRALGATVVQEGNDFDAAKLAGKEFAAERGHRFIEDGLDPEPAEGAATIGLELTRFPEPIDTVLIPLGNGALFSGVARAVKERSPGTVAVAVQASGAPAMTESLRSGSLVTRDSVDTIADGIGIRVPIPEALEDIAPLLDDSLLVSEEGIIEAMRLLHLHAGVVVEPSGAVGVAALLEHAERFRGQNVATILCGSNMTREQMHEWLAPDLRQEQ